MLARNRLAEILAEGNARADPRAIQAGSSGTPSGAAAAVPVAVQSESLRRTLLRPNGLRVAAPAVARKGEAWWAVLDSNQFPTACIEFH